MLHRTRCYQKSSLAVSCGIFDDVAHLEILIETDQLTRPRNRLIILIDADNRIDKHLLHFVYSFHI